MDYRKHLFNSKVIDMKNICLIFLLTLVLSSCSYTTTFVDNDYQLVRTTSTFDSAKREINKQYYKDEYITINLTKVTKSGIHLVLLNNHSSSIRIIWDDAAFIDAYGFAHRINHDNSPVSDVIWSGSSTTHTRSGSSTTHTNGSSTSYSTHSGNAAIINRESSQPSYAIPANSRIKTVIYPADDTSIIRFEGLNTVEYNNIEMATNDLNRYRAYMDDTTIKLILPIVVNNERIEYTVTFVDKFKMYSVKSFATPFPALLLSLPLIILVLGL